MTLKVGVGRCCDDRVNALLIPLFASKELLRRVVMAEPDSVAASVPLVPFMSFRVGLGSDPDQGIHHRCWIAVTPHWKLTAASTVADLKAALSSSQNLTDHPPWGFDLTLDGQSLAGQTSSTLGELGVTEHSILELIPSLGLPEGFHCSVHDGYPVGYVCLQCRECMCPLCGLAHCRSPRHVGHIVAEVAELNADPEMLQNFLDPLYETETPKPQNLSVPRSVTAYLTSELKRLDDEIARLGAAREDVRRRLKEVQKDCSVRWGCEPLSYTIEKLKEATARLPPLSISGGQDEFCAGCRDRVSYATSLSVSVFGWMARMCEECFDCLNHVVGTEDWKQRLDAVLKELRNTFRPNSNRAKQLGFRPFNLQVDWNVEGIFGVGCDRSVHSSSGGLLPIPTLPIVRWFRIDDVVDSQCLSKSDIAEQVDRLLRACATVETVGIAGVSLSLREWHLIVRPGPSSLSKLDVSAVDLIRDSLLNTDTLGKRDSTQPRFTELNVSHCLVTFPVAAKVAAGGVKLDVTGCARAWLAAATPHGPSCYYPWKMHLLAAGFCTHDPSAPVIDATVDAPLRLELGKKLRNAAETEAGDIQDQLRSAAIACFREALNRDPQLHVAWEELGLLLAPRNETIIVGKSIARSAQDCLVTSLEISDSSPQSWAKLGELLMLKGLDATVTIKGTVFSAFNCFVRSLALDDKAPHIWIHLGEVMASQGDQELNVTIHDKSYTSRKCFAEALKLDLSQSLAWKKLAALLSDPPDGVTVRDVFYTRKQCLSKCVSYSPTDAEAWELLGKSLGKDEKTVPVNAVYYTAQQCFVKALEINPNLAEAWNSLGVSIEKGSPPVPVGSGKFSKRQCYLEALRCNSKFYKSWINLGVTLERESVAVPGFPPSETFTQRRCYTQALSFQPQHANIWFAIGCSLSLDESATVGTTSYSRQGCFVEALKHDPKYAAAWDRLAMSMTDGGKVTVNGKEYSKSDCSAQAQEISKANFNSNTQ
jgi:tetratricopeptide (TPR) repeat protein